MNDEAVSAPQGEQPDEAEIQSGGDLGGEDVTSPKCSEGADELIGSASMLEEEEQQQGEEDGGAAKENANAGDDPLHPSSINACTSDENKGGELPLMGEDPTQAWGVDTGGNYPPSKEEPNSVHVEEGLIGNNSIYNNSPYVSHSGEVGLNQLGINQMADASSSHVYSETGEGAPAASADWTKANGEDAQGGIPLNGAAHEEGGAKGEEVNPPGSVHADQGAHAKQEQQPHQPLPHQPLPQQPLPHQPPPHQPVCMRPSNTYVRNIVKKQPANMKNSIHNLNFLNVNSMTFDPSYCSEGANVFLGSPNGGAADGDDGMVIKNARLPSGATMAYSSDIAEEDLHHIYSLLNGELTRSPHNDKEIHRVKDEMISLHRNNPTELLTLQRCYANVRANRKLIDVLFGFLGGGSVGGHTKWDSSFSQGAALNYLSYETVNNMHQVWRQDVAGVGAAQRNAFPFSGFDCSGGQERGGAQNWGREKKKKKHIGGGAASECADLRGDPLTSGGVAGLAAGVAGAGVCPPNQWNAPSNQWNAPSNQWNAPSNQWNVPPQEAHPLGGVGPWASPPAMVYGKHGEAERTMGGNPPWGASGVKEYHPPYGQTFQWLNQSVETKNEKYKGSPMDVGYYNCLSEDRSSLDWGKPGEGPKGNPHQQQQQQQQQPQQQQQQQPQQQQPQQPLSSVYKCVSCKRVCTHVYYILKPNSVKKISYGVLDKCVWCNACFNSSKYPSILNRSNFVKVNIPYSFLGKDWSVTEIERLIDGISKYKNNWEKISESIGTKSAYECIFKFTSMPLSNPFFDIDNLLNINNVSFKSFKQNNTLLSLLSFICNYISPYIGAYAAKKIVDFILNKQRECVARAREREECKEREDHEERKTREQWEKRENPDVQTGEVKVESFEGDQDGGEPRGEDNPPAAAPKGEDPTEANSTDEKPAGAEGEGASEPKPNGEDLPEPQPNGEDLPEPPLNEGTPPEANQMPTIAEGQHDELSKTGSQGAAPMLSEGVEVVAAQQAVEAADAAEVADAAHASHADVKAEGDDPNAPGGNPEFVPLNVNLPPKDSASSTYILNEKDMQEIHNTIINASKKRARQLADLERHNIRKLLKELAVISTRKVKLKLKQYQYLQNYFDSQNQQMERKRARHGDEDRAEANEQNSANEQSEEKWHHPQSEQNGQDAPDALDAQGQGEPHGPDASQMAL
ncbi:conserved Plasmodium protein, unknown function [Plasmodium vivax]|uniref:Uncharacterized protein n=1 Tax=Plasmodium vivax TaxID=5855 RepID=A0A565A3A4_PLAVI|nr:conserved Plasmodium protein, unknown function [Plasmodium vivax]